MSVVKMVEISMNIVAVPQGWYTLCALSKDKDMTTGLPKLFNDTYRWQDRLGDLENGKAYLVGNAFAIVVKEHAYDKADKSMLEQALNDLAMLCALEGVTRLAMPKICCGHNGMFWKDVKEMIVAAFQGLNIEILICA